MPDEQTTPEQGGTKSEEAPTADSSNEASASRRKPSSGRSLGWWAVCFVLVVLVLIIGGYGYLLYVNLNPDSGPDGFQVRRVASTASNYLSSDPSVTSAEATGAEANINGSSVTVDAHLKDGTSVEAAANLLASTRQKTLQQEPDYSGDFIISVSWTVNGSTIDVDVQCQRDSEAIRTDVKRALTPVGEAKTFTGSIDAYTKLTIDYGQVTALPTSLTQPSVPNSSKTFTMNGWKVTSTPKTDGQFSNPPFDQIITAAGQASPTGTIDLDGTTLSVTGLVTDENKGLTPEAAAPVVHAVADCQAAGLTTLKLNGKLQKGLSSDDLWITFVCNNGTWASKYDSPSPSDTEILNKAAEL
ncbi:hypothetical protein HMPREF0059_00874 [Actinomyces viscosus C505]|uniref:Uncharacterized protein n=1 Tax=Actinomyces viscosus C505 TaxID=562973 RepID=F2UXS2_ACTVI|nr:hypothetical protein [Actinomyces viscosus]EGE38023.1 hypothetical protein HMPREF0059_00874 [Actinomyces viscosus C505]